ncbi:response regulator transcription factor [Isoptericola sp. b441]|uniref:Response regulator transcription factor n=1 Tax=Actinotalea lenta TaxID=3064654 RepID=A0ABT9DAX7_9CELL|nr:MULTISPECIES: response regulator transcription factor [unclassified Isoptericola]MDO8108016.1 response regulator transcription factor [Isoptericola sp. b441]MDO8120314.1 response regulator transcription factor [Isoptericola sp. b490]
MISSTQFPRGAGITVFLVDDHELLRRGLRDVLGDATGVRVVGEHARAQGAAARILAVRPDVALLDVRLPDGSGVQVCREVRASDPSIRVLMLTTFDDEHAEVAASMAGASGFLLKQIASRELIAALRAVVAGRPVPHAGRAGPSASPMAARLLSLTAQEQRVLALVADGLTNRQIGEQIGLRESTVKNYVTTIMGKLGFERRTQAAVFAAGLRDS